MVFNTTRGEIKFNVYETMGQEVTLDPFDYMEADCAIVMFDVTRFRTCYNVQHWSSNVVRASRKENLRVLIVRNKCDLEDKRQFFQDHFESDLVSPPYMEVSAMISDWKCVAPLECLAQILLGDDELKFVEGQTYPPPLLPLWFLLQRLMTV